MTDFIYGLWHLYTLIGLLLLNFVLYIISQSKISCHLMCFNRPIFCSSFLNLMSFVGPKNLMSFDGPWISCTLMDPFFVSPPETSCLLMDPKPHVFWWTLPLLKPHVFWWTQKTHVSLFFPFLKPHVFWWTQKPHVFWWTLPLLKPHVFWWTQKTRVSLFFPFLKPHFFWWTQNLVSFNGPWIIFWVHQ